MKLSDYLTDNKITAAAFARLLGISEVSVTRYAAGSRIPRKQHMLAIAEKTKGDVSANDFFGIIASPSETRAA